ncbi:MAG: TrgA family protein [Paracoccaceae bacterium]|nr:TrgA family protein [Paracoccaceae bacterium]
MPTGAKLIGALAFAALAYFISDLIKPLLPEGTNVGSLSQVNAFVGAIMGWKVMGKGAGVTYRQSFGYGFTTMAAIIFWCLLVWSGHEMLKRSIRLYYDGPSEALQEMATLYVDYAKLAAVQEVIIPAAVGVIFVSWLTEYFARRWT